MPYTTNPSEYTQFDREQTYFQQQGNYEDDIVVDEELVEQLMVVFPFIP